MIAKAHCALSLLMICDKLLHFHVNFCFIFHHQTLHTFDVETQFTRIPVLCYCLLLSAAPISVNQLQLHFYTAQIGIPFRKNEIWFLRFGNLKQTCWKPLFHHGPGYFYKAVLFSCSSSVKIRSDRCFKTHCNQTQTEPCPPFISTLSFNRLILYTKGSQLI